MRKAEEWREPRRATATGTHQVQRGRALRERDGDGDEDRHHADDRDEHNDGGVHLGVLRTLFERRVTLVTPEEHPDGDRLLRRDDDDALLVLPRDLWCAVSGGVSLLRGTLVPRRISPLAGESASGEGCLLWRWNEGECSCDCVLPTLASSSGVRMRCTCERVRRQWFRCSAAVYRCRVAR